MNVMQPFAWVGAATISQAAAAASGTVAEAMVKHTGAAGPEAVGILKAGGIDLLDLMKENLLAPARLVNLKAIPGLEDIVSEADGGLRIGSMVTLARLGEHPEVRSRYPALADAARGAASPQIRNVATLGGNLLQRPRCWYFRAQEYRCLRKGGEHCFAISGENQYHAIFANRPCAIVHASTAATALVALGAAAELADAHGAVQRLPLEEFFVSSQRDPQRENVLQAGQIMTAIRLPPLPAGTRMAHLKQGERDSFDWPLADVAVVLELADGLCRRAAVILGAAAPVPHRAKAAEQALLGKAITEQIALQAGQAALEGATPLGKNSYKLPLFEAMVRRALARALARG